LRDLRRDEETSARTTVSFSKPTPQNYAPALNFILPGLEVEGGNQC
jgi:hypothetical protein